MARHLSTEHSVTIVDNAETLEVIQEEQHSPAVSSSVNINTQKEEIESESVEGKCTKCACVEQDPIEPGMSPEEIEKLLAEKEELLREEFKQTLETHMNELKEKFDYILQNEQIRTSYMLREAHRERQEKITALQTQLECKNMAGLMYVMCSERRKSKLEKLRIIEEYTNYIRALQNILSEGQNLILHLSRGYKTASRVDHEWKEKMKKVIKEFQAYVYNFNGGTPELNQYIFDLPKLLKTEAPIHDNTLEDPCECEDVSEEILEPEQKKTWWEQLESDCKPFVVFGDMAEFNPPQRREVLKIVKAAKTAPRKWKEYVFNEMFFKSDCPNADVIKDESPKRFPVPTNWECHAVQTLDQHSSKVSLNYNRRQTSADIRANMGSILKIITSNAVQPVSRATLLGARDSMEIQSTTRLREKHRQSELKSAHMVHLKTASQGEVEDEAPEERQHTVEPTATKSSAVEEEDEDSLNMLDIHDSFQVTPGHKPEPDRIINYEKVCPMKECQHLQVDSFVRSLPPYMRASPFTHFEQTYEDYETCSPEQLEILKQRIENKKNKEKPDTPLAEENPLAEWTPSVEGIAVQTSELYLDLPPCTCEVPMPTPASSIRGDVYRVEDLLPVKQTLDQIERECFYDSSIDFDRFKVIGMESSEKIPKTKEEFKRTRMQEIRKILKKYPSMCDIFQANAR